MKIKKLELEVDKKKVEKKLLCSIIDELYSRNSFVFGKRKTHSQYSAQFYCTEGMDPHTETSYREYLEYEEYSEYKEHIDYNERPHRDHNDYSDGREHSDHW